MNSAVTKTLSLLILIVIGYMLQKRIMTKDQKAGIKEIILTVALPAMIFISLQKVKFELEMIVIPIMALLFNFIIFFLADWLLPLLKIEKGTSNFRTFKMLIPSLAPGLSCFPFLLEYIGETTLANAALADIGNKTFVLIILYLISVKWYHQVQQQASSGNRQKLKFLLQSMVKEPVNFAIIIGLLMLALGIRYESFPPFLKMSIDRLSLIMTPLILLFIGISVKPQLNQIKTILCVLLSKSGVTFILSGLVIVGFGVTDPAMVMLIILFPQSSFSFWPFAHMSAITKTEQLEERKHRTFNLDFAMNILAFSLPYSTILILSLCTFSEYVAQRPQIPFGLGIALLSVAFIPNYIRYLQKGVVFKNTGAPAKSVR